MCVFRSKSTNLWIYPLSMLILSPILYLVFSTLENSVLRVEEFHILLLLGGALVSGFLAYQQKDKRIFWLWAMMWWIVLFGRSINWGRLIWPEYSREMYRMIAIALVLMLCVPLFVSRTRNFIVNVIREYGVPCHILAVLIVMFMIVDQVEHIRVPFSYLYTLLNIQDLGLLEEITETFFIAGLFEYIRYYK